MGFWLSDGTISLVSNSKTVTGTGTAFKSGANPARVGQSLIIYVGGNAAIYEIERVDSDSSMQIAMPWRGATISNTPYAINTASDGSPSDLARRAAQVMGYYQGQLDVIQKLLSGTGAVTATLPDGTVITLPAWSSLPTKEELNNKQNTGTIKTSGSTSNKDWNTFGGFNLQNNVSLSSMTLDDGNGAGANSPPLKTKYGTALFFGAASFSSQIAINDNGGMAYRTSYLGQAAKPWFLVRDTSNTTVDSNGYIKAASPVMRLYGDANDDSIAFMYRDEGWERSGCSIVNQEAIGAFAERIGVGFYRITGCHGFAREGWYIETPNDANGNKLLFVRYQQHDDGGIEIWTSSPDYSSGRCAEGEPVDIPVGRWIDLRLCMDDRDISLAS